MCTFWRMSEKIRDRVGMLQESFEELLRKMQSSIFKIHEGVNCHVPVNVQEQAEDLVKQTLIIDKLIDELEESAFIGCDIESVKRSLEEESAEYEDEVKELGTQCEKARKWLDRIDQMHKVMARNIPWLDYE